MPSVKTSYTVDENLSSQIGAKISDAAKILDDTMPMMHEISLLLHSKAVIKLQKGKRSGIIYKKFAKRQKGAKRRKSNAERVPIRIHQASADGENPKSDTGFLLSSLRFRATKRFGIVSTSARYASHLEDPDEGLNRPWLNQTLDESGNLINRIVAKHVARAIKL